MKRASIVVVLLLFLLPGCGAGGGGGGGDDHHSLGAQQPSSSPVTEIKDPSTLLGLEQLARAADLVVSGAVTKVEPGVNVGSDRTAGYTVVTVSPTETIRGAGSRSVDVLMMTTVGGAPVNIVGRPVPAVGTVGLWFLQRIDATFDFPGYVLLGQGGGVLFDSAGKVANPADIPVLEEAAELGSRAAIISRIRELD